MSLTIVRSGVPTLLDVEKLLYTFHFWVENVSLDLNVCNVNGVLFGVTF